MALVVSLSSAVDVRQGVCDGNQNSGFRSHLSFVFPTGPKTTPLVSELSRFVI